MNSLQIILFLSKLLKNISLHTVKWFQAFLPNTNNSITQ